MTPRLLCVVGARPNFVKMAPVVHALRDQPVEVELLHTGQHYDRRLSGAFLEQLDLPDPDHALNVGSGTHAEQTAAVLLGTERVLAARVPDAVLVAGDVNSTMAAALAAVKLHVAVVHLESGLRSGDWTMPEEVNRVVTDRISDLLLCTSEDARSNLISEGVGAHRIAVVGNTMIDSLLRLLDRDRVAAVERTLGVSRGNYLLATLHRPALVDDPVALGAVLEVLGETAGVLPVVLPLHPRTRARLDEERTPVPQGIHLLEPLEYLDFIALEAGARAIVTDSGGVQEEAAVLGIPCLTYRETTERPVTVSMGTNRLVGVDPQTLRVSIADVLASPHAPEPSAIPMWDGAAGPRAAAAIADFLLR